MDTLKRYGILFGFSTCHHSKNTQPADMETPEELFIFAK